MSSDLRNLLDSARAARVSMAGFRAAMGAFTPTPYLKFEPHVERLSAAVYLIGQAEAEIARELRIEIAREAGGYDA